MIAFIIYFAYAVAVAVLALGVLHVVMILGIFFVPAFRSIVAAVRRYLAGRR